MADYTDFHFPSEESAEAALKDAGCSLGRMQRNERCGVMFGDYDIQKWRNLSKQDIAELHGVYKRSRMDGPVTITLRKSTCPPSVFEDLKHCSEAA